ncbi:hypothetical protein BJV77DRAFT_988834 [Russula vinacea]|nr:hypothetical protein BJV77DRAFT_988834 [Russula vinacea]
MVPAPGPLSSSKSIRSRRASRRHIHYFMQEIQHRDYLASSDNATNKLYGLGQSGHPGLMAKKRMDSFRSPHWLA